LRAVHFITFICNSPLARSSMSSRFFSLDERERESEGEREEREREERERREREEREREEREREERERERRERQRDKISDARSE